MPIDARADGTAGRDARLARMLRPASVLVAGGEEAAEVIRQCRRLGWDGPLWALHPHRETIEGVRCVRKPAELPGVPDAAFLAVPPEATIALVGELAARGAGGAVCYASGFAEAGDTGSERQRRLIEAAGTMAIVGPNGYGFIDYLHGFALWPDRHGAAPLAAGERGVAIVTQSGNLALNLTMQRRHLPIARVVAIGNAAVTGFDAWLRVLAADPRISAIGLHIEGLADVPAFAAAAEAALAAGVPVVALKTGASRLGARLAASHTSALASEDRLVDALLRRIGVARVGDLGEFVETLKLLHAGGPLPAASLAAMACSGGEASLIADLGERRGITFPAPDADAVEQLHAALGERVAASNPLDYHTYAWGDVPVLTEAFSAMAALPAALALLVLDFPFHEGERPFGWDEALEAFVAAVGRSGRRAAVVSTLGELMPAPVARRLRAAGIAPLGGLREALVAVAAAAAIGARRTARAEPPLAGPAALAATDVSSALETLDEAEGKALLAAAGVQVPAGCVIDAPTLAARLADAEAAAARIGHPLVLKALDAGLMHKTEHGAVRLGLRDAGALQAAGRALAAHPRWLLEAMVAQPVAELIVGIVVDPLFGPALTIGAGGVAVEVLDDTQTLLLPASDAAVAEALGRLRCAPLLAGHRGRPAADMAAIVAAVQAVARLALDPAQRIAELDVNPLIATPHGAVAADVLLRRRPG